MPPTIRELLYEPFGPYPENEILYEEQRPTKKKALVINDLELILDGKLSGLDYTESLRKDHDIKFFGVVELSSLGLLSDTGREMLRKDVMHRTGITLDSIYNKDRPTNGLTVKLVIMGEKRLNVKYIGANAVDGLLLISEYRHEDGSVYRRNWNVESMFDHTYVRSRLYLRRWRFRNLIQRLSGQFNAPPTCQWLIQEYIRNSHSDAVYVEPPEVRSMFALHAEWMLEEQAQTIRKFIDVGSWERFLGSPDEVDLEDVEMEEREDLDTPRLTRSARKAQSQVIRVDSPSPVPEPHLFYQDPKVLEDYAGDSGDESEFSSPERSPSPEPPALVDAKIYCLIPPSFYEEPPIPMDFKWLCDTKLCSYTIDLLNPSDSNLDGLSARELDFLRKQKWTLGNHALQKLFQRMVYNHRVDHLHSWNIGVRETGQPKFYWIKLPSVQRSIPQFVAVENLRNEA